MRASILPALLLLGCPRQARLDAALEGAEPPPLPAAGPCPDGGVLLGAAPPSGTDLWCALPGTSTDWVRHGPEWTWYTQGARHTVGAWDHGRRTGHAWTWREDGTLATLGEYADGEAAGYWMHLDPSGLVVAEGSMAAGEREGTWILREPGGGWSEGAYVRGQADDRWVEHAPDGAELRERIWRAGRMVSQRELSGR
ncbi:MAG TPA: hypothetical protein PKA64_10770 [Myxococcota bacterium]|nr:hypothetical protein [Myxococcota bacterium]